MCEEGLLLPSPSSDPSPSQDYHLMSDALPEDKQLRQSLQLARLVGVACEEGVLISEVS